MHMYFICLHYLYNRFPSVYVTQNDTINGFYSFMLLTDKNKNLFTISIYTFLKSTVIQPISQKQVV